MRRKKYRCPECGGALQASSTRYWKVDERGQLQQTESDLGTSWRLYCENDHQLVDDEPNLCAALKAIVPHECRRGCAP